MYYPFCLTAPSSKYPPSLQSQVYMAFSWTYYTRKSAARNIMKLLRGCTRLVIPQMNLRTVSWQSWSSLWISLWPWLTRSISYSVLASTRVSRILRRAVTALHSADMFWKAFVNTYPLWFDTCLTISKVLILHSEVFTVFLPRIKTLVVILSRRAIASLLIWVLPIKPKTSLPEQQHLIILVRFHQSSMVTAIKYLGRPLTVRIVSEVLRAVYAHNNIRRAPGKSGKLKRFPESMNPQYCHAYLDSKYSITPWPGSSTFLYDA